MLLRVDFNVPLDGQGKVLDSSRIDAALPTIRYLLQKKCKIVLLSHMGRPKMGPDPKLSLKPCVPLLEEKLGRKVIFSSDCVGKVAEEAVSKLQPGEVLLLENLRFHSGEEAPGKEPGFVSALSQLGSFYVDDAFGCAHRAHASIVGLAEQFKGRRAAGFLLEKEYEALSKVFKNPTSPFVALIGGAKVSSKLGVLKALLEKVDTLALGGAMAFTFLKAQGIPVGDSLVENDLLDESRSLIAQAKSLGKKILLPKDAVIARALDSEEIQTISLSKGIPEGFSGYDIGPETVKEFSLAMEGAKTLFWNGPMGVFETPRFSAGTQAIAKVFARSEGYTIAGGGETVAALMQTSYFQDVDHISTGGGASLEMIENGTLPGIEVLS